MTRNQIGITTIISLAFFFLGWAVGRFDKETSELQEALKQWENEWRR